MTTSAVRVARCSYDFAIAAELPQDIDTFLHSP
jgi:hypothetical protein